MLDVKNKKTRRYSLFLIMMLAGCSVTVTLMTGCDQTKPMLNTINQKAINLKNRIKKEASDSLKAKQVKSRAKSATLVTKVVPQPAVAAIESNKIAERPLYKSKIAKLRDPFIPFIKFTEETEKGHKKKKHLLPLQRYTLTQLKLIAIIDAGSAGKWAMVQDASGKGYTLKKGMPVGSEGGFVKDIFRDKVIVQQNVVNLLGKKKKKLTAIKLHPEKKGE